MWQEIVVGFIVLLAVIFMVHRLVRNFKSGTSEQPNCSCDCSKCPLDKENCSAKLNPKNSTSAPVR
ncbi:MAG: FeoB-associated Cys-rich membrane protein [Desulfomonilaceae bacterium]